ncbi:hypothetical protein F4802DRAFT_617985 [Xylaria palmicola]|nr:hypothetical protein F4802DRAFT_617985 [Xylaria palmicola]
MDISRQGIWTNWGLGPVLGLTFTTTKSYGNFIIAFMAIFVAFVINCIWKIACISIHRGYSTTKSRDTLHHQRQVILRNSSSPGSGLSAFLCLLLAWRGTSIRRHLRLWPVILLALLCLLGGMLSGSVFSATSTIAGNMVEYPYGFRYGTIPGDTELLHDSSVYAHCCYNSTVNTAPCVMSCAHFVVAHLPMNETNTRAECPFQSQVCRSTNANLRLDTGYIDSNDHMGLNAPTGERFAWRYVLHCAPLQTYNFTSNGRRGNNHVQSDFGPIAELDRPDADLVIAFLSGNGVLFRQALDDDWYQATVPIATTESTPGSKPTLKYRPLNAASPMGCLQQMQWCNSAYPKDRGCGPLASAHDAFHGAAPLFNLTTDEAFGLNSLRPYSSQAAGARLVWSVLAVLNSPASFLDVIIMNLGSRSLISQFQSNNGIQQPIPLDQWQDDVRHWCNTALASLQATFMKITTTAFSQAPLTEEETKICQSQKYRSDGHISFSVFVLGFIVVFGVVAISISYLLEPFFSHLSKRNKSRQYSHLEWVTNEALQLHRLVHEGHSQTTWLRCDQGVPINDAEALLPSLDISDPEHPTLG